MLTAYRSYKIGNQQILNIRSLSSLLKFLFSLKINKSSHTEVVSETQKKVNVDLLFNITIGVLTQ